MRYKHIVRQVLAEPPEARLIHVVVEPIVGFLMKMHTPDGLQIAFASLRDGDSEVYVMQANGSGQTNITNNGATDFEVSWSP